MTTNAIAPKPLAIAITALTLCLTAGCSMVSDYRGRVVDDKGRGIPDAYVIYRYMGMRNAWVCSSPYYKPGNVLRTDAEGCFYIPKTILWHTPIAQTGASLLVGPVYDPRTHCVGAPRNDCWQVTTLDEFKSNNWWYDYYKQDDVHTLVFHNVTADPVEWYKSATYLSGALKYGIPTGHLPDEVKRDLRNHMLREYEEFKNKYGEDKCLFRQSTGYIRNQFPISRQEFDKHNYLKSKYSSYEKFVEAKEEWWVGKTWREFIDRVNKWTPYDDTRLFSNPDK